MNNTKILERITPRFGTIYDDEHYIIIRWISKPRKGIQWETRLIRHIPYKYPRLVTIRHAGPYCTITRMTVVPILKLMRTPSDLIREMIVDEIDDLIFQDDHLWTW